MATYGEKSLFGKSDSMDSQGENDAGFSVASRRGVRGLPHLKMAENFEGYHHGDTRRAYSDPHRNSGHQSHNLEASPSGNAYPLSAGGSPSKHLRMGRFTTAHMSLPFAEDALTDASDHDREPISCPARMTWKRPSIPGASEGSMHPLVAILRGMRNHGAENMAYAMAMSLKAEAEATKHQAEAKAREERDRENEAKFGTMSPLAGRRSHQNQNQSPHPAGRGEEHHDGADASSAAHTAASRAAQGKRELETVNATYVYNLIVDGTSAHALVDTRCETTFGDGHIWRSMNLNKATGLRGKHFVLVSEMGEMMGREWHAVEKIEKSEGALSIKLLEGGFGGFEEMYPFLCEKAYSSAKEEMERKRWVSRRALPSRITPYMFLGGKECAEDHETCRSLGITHVLSILMDPRGVRVPPSCLHLPLSIEDEPAEDISVFFEQAFRWMDAAVKGGSRVLVHCKVGRCRSATMCAVYLMRAKGMSLDAAMRHLKACRRQVHINHGFTRQLQTYEVRLFGAPGVGGTPKALPLI